MHAFSIPDSLVAQIVRRYGVAHVHARMDPRRTALVVIDMQNGYLVEAVAAVHVPEAVTIIPNVNRLATAMREAGGQVFWIQNTISEETRQTWSNWFAMFFDEAAAATRAVNLEVGQEGHRLHADLDVRPQDAVVLKQRFSALIQGACDLDERLRLAGVETLVIVGTLTNVCCESTARDAMMLNYKTIMVSDANATLSDAEHAAALLNVYNTFGDVMTTDELIGFLHEAAGPVAAAAEG